jgi:UDP-glucose 4-epimerase
VLAGASGVRIDDLGVLGHAGGLPRGVVAAVPAGASVHGDQARGRAVLPQLRELYGVQSTILRFGIPYGPRARPAAVLPSMVDRALAGEPLTIAGDGSQSRRFVYVEDLADDVVRALAPVAANRTYNLVSDVDVTIHQLAETVRSVLCDVAIEFTPGRTGDFAGAPVSGARAASELGWRATTPIVDGVRRYVEWRGETPVPPPAPARDGSLAALARRTVLALAWALATAVRSSG